MKKIGIVGGIGPVSTLDYYASIIDEYRSKALDENDPDIIIDSINTTKVLGHIAGEEWEALADMLVRAIQNLASGGAEFAAIACNTVHLVFEKVKRRSPLPLISIVDATCDHAKAAGCRHVAVFGTRSTMGGGLYADAFKQYDIDAVIPSKEEQEIIHHIIFPKLEEGIVVPEDKEKMLAIASGLQRDRGADALLLGCTELPLMIKEKDVDMLLLNTVQIHVAAIVKAALE